MHKRQTNASQPDAGRYRDAERADLRQQTKAQLIDIVIALQEALSRTDARIADLTAQLVTEQARQAKHKQTTLNQTVNQPSSKRPEWDKDGNLKKGKPGKRKTRRKKRPGCGNQPKTRTPDETHFIPLTLCPDCNSNLRKRPGAVTAGRLIEDIDPPQEKTVLSEEVGETKWCPQCKKMVSSRTERALPGSDIGLNATIEITYLWVMSALPLPKIKALLANFKALTPSTAGISRMMIRLGELMRPIHDEIQQDVRQGARLWADETGWRVKGKLWWLWIFANERSAYYWVAPCRGGPVVEAVLGPVFLGVLIVDAWGAYNQIVCDKQTCMAHIFRKIRAHIDAYPQYRSIMHFYLKLRRIIKDGQKLQQARADLGETIFERRLNALNRRLDELLAWKNPNQILKTLIAKVNRQRQHVLTFITHEGATSHNNYGEYIIKKGVLKRKVSGGSMSAEGARAYACLQSVAMTCQLRKMSFHAFMKASLIHYIRTGTPMLLSEYEAHQQQPEQQAA